MHGCCGRHHQGVHAGDALVGVNEQPLPVERNHLHVQRFGLGRQRTGGIEVVRPDPGDAAKKHNRQERDRPDDQLQPARIGPVGQMLRPGVGGAIPPRHPERRQDGRDDDRQHDGQGVEQDHPLGGADRPLCVQDAGTAAAERQDHRTDTANARQVADPSQTSNLLTNELCCGPNRRGRHNCKTLPQ